MSETDVISQLLAMLNDDPARPYAITYVPGLQAWRVVKLVMIEDAKYKQDQVFKLVPSGTNHHTIREALSDAIKLKGLV